MKSSVIVIALSVSATAALADSYTDEAAWRAAAPGYVNETFESIAAGTQLSSLTGLGVTFDLLNNGVNYPSVQDTGNTGGFSRSGTQILLNDIDFALPGLGPITIRPASSSQPITAIGYWNCGGDDTTRISVYDVNDALIESADSPSSFGFIGIVSTTPIHRAVISEVGGNGYFTLDDLQIELGAGLSLSTSGSCPGSVTADISGATANGSVGLVGSPAAGSFIIPLSQTCGGTMLGLSGNGIRLITVLQADANGDASFTGNAPAATCNFKLQAIDAATCNTSNVADVP